MKTISTMITVLMSLVWMATASAMDVKLQWEANSEPDLAGYKVYYGVDGLASPAYLDVSNQTSATVSGLDPDMNYSFAVAAYNTSGLEGPYSNVVTAIESVLPVVSISNPGNNAKVSNTVDVMSSASDNIGVVKVEYYVNGTLKETNDAEPYLFSWDTLAVAPGVYSISAKAYDAAGNVGDSTVTVNVVNDVTSPTIFYTTPVQGSSVSGTINVSCNASDDVVVSRVEFFVNGAMRAVVNYAPYYFSWDTNAEADGSYTLSAKAYDAAGNVGQSSDILVAVNNAPVPAPVQVSGDINGDGKVSIADVLLAMKISEGKIIPTADQLARGDVAPIVSRMSYPDGKIDIKDVKAILGIVSGKVVLL